MSEAIATDADKTERERESERETSSSTPAGRSGRHRRGRGQDDKDDADSMIAKLRSVDAIDVAEGATLANMDQTTLDAMYDAI
ncbi:hypothetical protein KIPB_012596, partial [Kipferlia bialata]|eukprot:g12596.t1